MQYFYCELFDFICITLGNGNFSHSVDEVSNFPFKNLIISRYYIITATKLKSNSDQNLRSIAFKIFLNYIQMIGIVTSFDLKWPLYTRKFFAFQSGVGLISSDFFSLECFLKSNI